MDDLKNLCNTNRFDDFKKLYHNDKNVFQNCLPLFNILTYSLEMSLLNFATFIITETSFDVNLVDSNKNTAFLLCFMKGFYDIAIILIDNGFTNFSAKNNRGYSVFNYLNEQILLEYPRFEELFIQKEHSMIETPVKLELFNHNDLCETECRGNYGQVFYDPERGLIYKRIEIDQNHVVSIVREMMISRIVNIYDPKISPILYGLAFDKTKFYLVYESLTYSLSQAFFIYYKTPIETKQKYFKLIYKSILQSLVKIHSMGILHSDLKPDNIMIDSNGYLRIIDYGLSRIIGVTKSVCNYQCTPTYKAPDSDEDKGYIELTILENGQKSQLILETYRYNLSSDIYSFGTIIMNSLFLIHTYLLFCNNKIYYCPDFTNINELIPLENDKIDFINEFSPHLMDLLRRVYDIDSRTRISAVELLEHPFFTNKDIYQSISPILTTISHVHNFPYSVSDIKFGYGIIKNIDKIYTYNRSLPILNTDYSMSTEMENKIRISAMKGMYTQVDTLLNGHIHAMSGINLRINLFEILEMKRCYFDFTPKNVDMILNLLSNFINYPMISFSSCIIDMAIKKIKLGTPSYKVSDFIDYMFNQLITFFSKKSDGFGYKNCGELIDDIVSRYVSEKIPSISVSADDDEEDTGIIMIKRTKGGLFMD